MKAYRIVDEKGLFYVESQRLDKRSWTRSWRSGWTKYETRAKTWSNLAHVRAHIASMQKDEDWYEECALIVYDVVNVERERIPLKQYTNKIAMVKNL